MPPKEAARAALDRRRSQEYSEQRAAAAERRRLTQELRAAIEDESFIVHYQPRVALLSGAIVAAEALIRWPHRRRGLVSPGAFIPLAEQTGLITEIGGWCLRAACREAASWPGATSVSVNVSARQLREGSLIAQVARALGQSGLAPERLELELTESMLLDLNDDVLMVLGAMRDRGIGVALDDFGTGFASLGMLRQLPLSVMKLDRSLVRNLPHDPEDSQIVRAVVATGHALGLTVVGEGIETDAQRDFLAAIGTEQGQGYLFSRALDGPALRASLGAAATGATPLPPIALP